MSPLTHLLALTAAALLALVVPAAAPAADCREAARLAGQAGDLLETQPAEAEKALARAVELCADSASLRYNLGKAQAQQGRYAQAERSLEKALRLRPD